MKRTCIKFCGMTHADDVALACELGADALGFIFAPASRRVLEIADASSLVAATPLFVTRVGLFSDPSRAVVQAVLDRVDLDWLQFHGNESAGFCEQFGLPYLKAVAMGGDRPGNVEVMTAHPRARGFVFDAHAPGGSGGGGVTFDWSRFPANSPTSKSRAILAGGLSPDNVFDAITRTRPWAVDVVSGVEAAPGRKDADKMRRFIHEVRRADDASRDD